MSDTRSPYGDDVADPYSADDTKNPHEPAGDEQPEDGGDDDELIGEAHDDNGDAPAAAKKRGPGRPRKNPA